jgi:hypothetical protein
MKRYENFRIEDFIYKMDVFELKWLQIKFNPKYKHKIIIRARNYLSVIINFIYNEIIVTFMRYNFYVTERHK